MAGGQKIRLFFCFHDSSPGRLSGAEIRVRRGTADALNPDVLDPGDVGIRSQIVNTPIGVYFRADRDDGKSWRCGRRSPERSRARVLGLLGARNPVRPGLAGVLELLRPYLLRLATHSNSALGLTRREIEVLAWVAGGKTNAETAELLSIAPGTVKKHLDHIYQKLGVGTRTEAVATAMGFAPFAVRQSSWSD
jgi:DNA-binding CsgD family transcriptional regulator